MKKTNIIVEKYLLLPLFFKRRKQKRNANSKGIEYRQIIKVWKDYEHYEILVIFWRNFHYLYNKNIMKKKVGSF